MIGVRGNTVTRWETNVRRIPKAYQERLRKVLDGPLDQPRMERRRLARMIEKVRENGQLLPHQLASWSDILPGAIAAGHLHLEVHTRQRGDGRMHSATYVAEGPETADPIKPMSRDELRALRRSLDLTQVDLGRELGVRSVLVSRWETGQDPIPLGRAIQLRELIRPGAN